MYVCVCLRCAAPSDRILPCNRLGGEVESCTDMTEEFDPTLDSPARNALRVYSHCLQKGWQMGGVIGCAVVAPIVLYRRRGAANVTPALVNAVYRTVLSTTAVSVALCAARLASSPDFKAGVEDRAYRLHYNQGQNRVDLFSKVGTAVGGTAALLFLPASAAAVVSAGAAGAAFGVLAHIASAPKSQS
ncbi:hypothetical protein D9Q98_003138 [Chlorella vulgaris]|uniref:Uncharacterized protein n=1 Tax=Chlorella vulgaris TaxID=3077 RepID=A0A9D4TSF6_CHLVU|nr:hypothetical protein D9Q98_003138 [Chlorella vulgaris]